MRTGGTPISGTSICSVSNQPSQPLFSSSLPGFGTPSATKISTQCHVNISRSVLTFQPLSRHGVALGSSCVFFCADGSPRETETKKNLQQRLQHSRMQHVEALFFWLVVWLPFFIFPYIGFLIIPID